MSIVQISEVELQNYLSILDTAIGIMTGAIDDSNELEDTNVLAVGFSMGRSLELINMVKTELAKKSVNDLLD